MAPSAVECDIRSRMRTFGWMFPRRASLALLVIATATLTFACGGDGKSTGGTAATAPGTDHTAEEPLPSTSPTVVPLVTYDGSGEVVHPDAASTPAGWSATMAHVVATPYPGGTARFENPSYYDVLSSFVWTPPANSVNPVETAVFNSHLSDPDMVYDPDTRVLWMYYREVTADSNRIYVVRSADGTHWDSPVRVVAVPNHLAVSPSVVRRKAGDWLMWTVNAGTAGCNGPTSTVELRHSSNGLTWSPPETAQLMSDGETPWHVEVEWIPSRNEYWAVYNAKPAGSCMTKTLRFATSPDGLTWTVFPSPLLRAGAIPAFADIVYRTSIGYDAATNVVTILYSGARAVADKYAWQVASEQLDLKSLLARVAAPASSRTHMMLPERRTAPDLTNASAP